MEYRNDALVAANRREYGEQYSLLHFADPAEAGAALARRDEILCGLRGRASLTCRGTKYYGEELSPGCRLCAEGVWSCLFITGRCNCRCFYCPAPQDQVGEPTTNTLKFPNPADYLDYLARFGFRGVSLSGGEPLLAPEKTLKYLAAVKKRFGSAVHLWLYTNGTLLTPELVRKLGDAGLDEIRFDLGAIGYRLDPVRLAAGIIPHVTVEIPALPEDLPLMREKMGEMAEAGVRYLNLHQLRLTPHNFSALAGRGYTFLHGEKVTVLESELAALELLRHSLDAQLPLSVNYCSFVYKNRFQRLAARRRYAPLVLRPREEITAAGLLRALALTGPAEVLSRQAEAFAASGAAQELWELAGERLSFSPRLWDDLLPAGEVRVRHFEASLMPAVTYRNPFVEIPLNRNRKVVVERNPAGEETVLAAEERAFFAAVLRGEEPAGLPPALASREAVPAGLQDYY